jgi:hypothetical protein
MLGVSGRLAPYSAFRHTRTGDAASAAGRPDDGAWAAAAAAAGAAVWLPALDAQLGSARLAPAAAPSQRAAAAADAILVLAGGLAAAAGGERAAGPERAARRPSAAWLERHSALLAPAAQPDPPAEPPARLFDGVRGRAEDGGAAADAASAALLRAAPPLERLLQHLARWRSAAAAGAGVRVVLATSVENFAAMTAMNLPADAYFAWWGRHRAHSAPHIVHPRG